MRVYRGFFFLIFIFFAGVALGASLAPECGEIGSRHEGWYLDGELVITHDGNLAYDDCARKIVKCDKIGSRHEGWYITSIPEILEWDSCEGVYRKPVCRAVGTSSEGWFYKRKLLDYDSCAEKRVECRKVGTRNEGWYVFFQPKLLIRANCSD